MIDAKNGDLYTQNFKNAFSQDGFYAQPINTKIHLVVGEKQNQEEIIGNSVVMNVEESNDKIPVYSYNSDTFKKYLNGKKIITGYIALRKVTLTSFIFLIHSNKRLSDLKQQLEEEQIKYNELKKITLNTTQKSVNFKTNKINDNINNKYHFLINKISQRINNLSNKIQQIQLNKNSLIENQIYDYKGQLDEIDNLFQKNDLLYYLDANKNQKISFRIVYEGNLQNQELIIDDVLFTKKQTEINIERNDIIEVYQFIGNPHQ